MVLGRSCGPESYHFRGFTIPSGATLLASQIVVHRDPRFWEDPEPFDPLRFSEEKKLSRPEFAYFPFGDGSRKCISEARAWMEGVFVSATIFRSGPAGSAAGKPGDQSARKAWTSFDPRSMLRACTKQFAP